KAGVEGESLSSTECRTMTCSVRGAVFIDTHRLQDLSLSMENKSHYGVAADEALFAESDKPLAVLGGRPLGTNPGVPLNLDWVDQVRVNTSAVERRAQSHVARRTVKKDWQAAWLLRAITCMDLTTLSGDDTEDRVRRLCAKAKNPIQQDLVKKLG